MDIYSNLKTQALSEYNEVSTNVFSSKIEGLSLEEYLIVAQHYCQVKHASSTCTKCSGIIKAGQMVQSKGIVPLVEVFKSSFQSVTYHSLNAKRRLLQMPLVALRICNAKNGMGELYLMEKIPGVDYEHLAGFSTQTNARVTFKPGMTKHELKQLFTLTQMERERELIRYAIFKSSGSTPTEIRRTLGFECMKDRAAHVESCIKNAREVFESIDNLAQAQEMALLDCLGYTSETLSESSDGECENDDSTSAPQCSFNSVTENSVLLKILIESNLN